MSTAPVRSPAASRRRNSARSVLHRRREPLAHASSGWPALQRRDADRGELYRSGPCRPEANPARAAATRTVCRISLGKRG
jgi:hypothetical protein